MPKSNLELPRQKRREVKTLVHQEKPGLTPTHSGLQPLFRGRGMPAWVPRLSRPGSGSDALPQVAARAQGAQEYSEHVPRLMVTAQP